MDHNLSSDLKAILHSHRATIFYLEKCRVMQKDGRVLYLTEARKENQYWNIPVANTTCLLLGTGTSITQAAMRILAAAGVLVGFCGGGGTPLLMATEVEWLMPQSEYRPTQYLQGWMAFWFDEGKRLQAAQTFQKARIGYLRQVWGKDPNLKAAGFDSSQGGIEQALCGFEHQLDQADSVTRLLQSEALLTRQLYKMAARTTGYGDFVRSRDSEDLANAFLNHGNYLAYGLAATSLWVLGIPHGCALMHGKTRRGALVFDVADLIKDALILPWSFICAREQVSEQDFRQQCLQAFIAHKALDFMFEQVKSVALTMAGADHP